MIRIDLQLKDPLAAHVAARPYASWTGRPGAGSTVKRDLGRYYQLIAEDLRSLNLTEGEASLICDACNGSMWIEGGLHPRTHIVANVEDSIALNNLGSTWGLDEQQEHRLVKRLRKMSAGQTFALVDAIERFWAACETSTVQSVGMVAGE